MRRADRLFELIQILRAARGPLTAERLAEALEVSVRTVYRDVAALQAGRVPIDGAAGVGYLLRRGYDLPPLNFDAEEVEALTVALALLTRTGDRGLMRAAGRIFAKIEALRAADGAGAHGPLQVARWGAPPDDPEDCVSTALLRAAIRDERKLRILYRDGKERETRRILRTVALVYHIEVKLLVAWCELRGGLRHFRTDRIWACEALEARFPGEGRALREAWLADEGEDGLARLGPPR